MELEREPSPSELTITVKKKVVRTRIKLSPENVQDAILGWLGVQDVKVLENNPLKVEISPDIGGYGDWEYEGHIVTVYEEVL